MIFSLLFTIYYFLLTPPSIYNNNTLTIKGLLGLHITPENITVKIIPNKTNHLPDYIKKILNIVWTLWI